MSFVAIVAWTQENRVAKLAEFAEQKDAEAHVERVKSDFPDAFVAEAPLAPVKDWRVDPVGKTLSISPLPKTAAELAEEARLARETALKEQPDVQILVERLKNATPAQIDTWVENNMTNLAQARSVIGTILKVLAYAVRDH